VQETKLNCPNCGKKVTISADGEECPKCGQPIDAPPGTFGDFDDDEADQQDVAARLARLVGGHDILADDLPEEQRAGPAEAEPALDELLAEEDAEPVTAEPAPEPEDVALEEPEEVPSTVSEDTRSEAPASTAAGTWPGDWPAEVIPRDFDYLLWQTVAADAGDAAMVARLDTWRKAAQSGCDMWLTLPDGSRVPIPQMVLSEAGAAAGQGTSEEAWKEGWTRQLLEVAGKWPDEATKDGVVTTIMHTDAVIAKFREAGVWPWGNGSS
jgi:hypothetical protein